MQAPRTSLDRTELRRDRRYFIPVLEATIGGGQYRALNWSMGGLLIDGICQDIGTRVRGQVAISGSVDIIPFAATVVRIDPETGACAICFDDPHIEHLDHLEPEKNLFADQMH